jgi:pectinesterase
MSDRPDIIVAADGSGDFTSIQAAVDAIPENNATRKVIFIKRGKYSTHTRISRNFITLLGEDRQATRLEYALRMEDWEKVPDKVGRAVVNVESSDVTIRNLTIENTQPGTSTHAFTIYGNKLNRFILRDCDLFSVGADTFGPWNHNDGMYYVKNCFMKGGVGVVNVRGWCYMDGCSIHEVIRHAALRHDGSRDRDMKLVMRNCVFDGVNGFFLGRRHYDAQFYLIDCTFSENMADEYIFRQTYPYNPLQNCPNLWGDRAYYHNCHRTGGDYPWHKNNLRTAQGSPRPEDITPAWTFGGRWDPTAEERK